MSNENVSHTMLINIVQIRRQQNDAKPIVTIAIQCRQTG